jgi:formate hydrogenlyase subunit 6/NADH:ubiquinone oxidoreductase subunit I
MSRIDMKQVRHETRTLAGKAVPVVVVPRFRGGPTVASGLKGLFEGLGLTLDYLIHPSKVVTQQYPENRATLKFPERYRATLRMIHEEGTGHHRCTACRMCERACPNASIKLLVRKGEVSGKNELDRYIWRQDSCVFCNACVQVCPFDALEMTHDFENAVFDRRLLVYTLNRYAGPPASVLAKQEDPAVREKMMERRDRYGGPVPMNGTSLPNLPHVGSPLQPGELAKGDARKPGGDA